MINWPQFGKDSTFAMFSLYLNRVLKIETSFMLASLILQELVRQIANVQWRHTIGKWRQMHPFYFDGELVLADIGRCCKYRQ